MRFASIILLALFFAMPLSAQQESSDVVAKVTKIQKAAVAIQDALPRALEIGSDIQLGDLISTGKGARLEIEFSDGTTVKLGERAQFTVVEFVVGNNGGNAVMRMLEGAFQMSSGSMMQLADASMVMQTPTATIGIRGTTFWGGDLGNGFEVALIEGKGIDVETKVGRVALTNVGDGTRIGGENAFPTEPLPWGEQKLNDAIATVAFDN